MPPSRPLVPNGAQPHHSHSRAGPSLPGLPPPHLPSQSGHRPTSPHSPYDQRPTPSGSGSMHHLPPPPWTNGGSRWSNAAVTAPPPTARPHPSEMVSPTATPPLVPRKRKQLDDPSPSNDEIHLTKPGSSSQGPSPKRRPTDSPTNHMHMPPMGHPIVLPPPGLPTHRSPQQVPLVEMSRPILPPPPLGMLPPMQTSSVQPLHTPPMPHQSARTNQGLSPSLAMMLSPPASDAPRLAPPYPGRTMPPPPQLQPGPPPRMPEDAQPPAHAVRPSLSLRVPGFADRAPPPPPQMVRKYPVGPQSPSIPRR